MQSSNTRLTILLQHLTAQAAPQEQGGNKLFSAHPCSNNSKQGTNAALLDVELTEGHTPSFQVHNMAELLHEDVDLRVRFLFDHYPISNDKK